MLVRWKEDYQNQKYLTKQENSTSDFLPELSDLLPRLSVWTEYSFIVQPLQSQHLKWDKSDHILETNVKSAVQNKLNVSQ